MIITISRQAATNGLLIAQLVAECLRYRVYDKEIVDEISRRTQTDPDIVKHFDEVPIGPVDSMLWEWRSTINAEIYDRTLRETLQAIAARGHAVIIGRGANFVLHSVDVLRVRIVAPLELRVAMFQAGEQVHEQEARHWIAEQDRARRAFTQRHYHHDIDNPVAYDLTLNLDCATLEGAAALIAQAAQIRAGEHLPGTERATIPQYLELLTHHHLYPRQKQPGQEGRGAL